MSRIDPDAIPGADLDPDSVRTGSDGLRANGVTIRDGGADVVRDWQRLPASFQITGTEALYTAMAPVGSDTAVVGDALGSIAKALDAYADACDSIKARLDALRAQAATFVSKTDSFSSHVEWVSSAYTLGIKRPEKIDSWDQDPDLSAENNSLIRQVAAAEADWLDAQQRCADSIRAAVCLAPTGGKQEQALAKQLRSDDQLKTAWGSTSDRKESCSEKADTFGAHFLWDGVIVGFGWGTVKTLWTLQGFDPDAVWKAGDGLLHGDWSEVREAGQQDLAAMGQAWLGVAHLASAIAIPIPPAERMALLHSGALDWLPADVRKGAEDWTAGDGTALYGTVAGLVGLTLPTRWWDPKAYKADQVFKNWTENPGGAAGSSVANIGSFFIPGAGEARGVGVAADAAKAGDAAKALDGARLGDAIADGSVSSLKGLSADALRSTISGLSEADAAKLASELAKPELDTAGLGSLHLDDLQIHGPATPSDAAGAAGHGPEQAADGASSPHADDHAAAGTHQSAAADDARRPDRNAERQQAPATQQEASPASPADHRRADREPTLATVGASTGDAIAHSGEVGGSTTAHTVADLGGTDVAGSASHVADDHAPVTHEDAGLDHGGSGHGASGHDGGGEGTGASGHDDAHGSGEHQGAAGHDASGHGDATGNGDAHHDAETAPQVDPDAAEVQARMDAAQRAVDHGAHAFEDDAAAQAYGSHEWNDYADHLPQAQKDALHVYTLELKDADRAADPTAFDYHEINGALRGDAALAARPDVAAAIEQLDKALAGHATPETTVITRATDIGHWGFEPQDGVGQRLPEGSYISTSLGGVAAGFEDKAAILHLQVPKGTPALWVEHVSAYPGERELLLGRGLEWRIDDVVWDGRWWQVYGRVLR